MAVASDGPCANHLHFTQTDNRASTSLNFLKARCSSWLPTNSVIAVKAYWKLVSCMVHASKIIVLDHLRNWWWLKYFCPLRQATSHLGKLDVCIMCGVSSMQLFRSSSNFNSIGQSLLSQEERRTANAWMSVCGIRARARKNSIEKKTCIIWVSSSSSVIIWSDKILLDDADKGYTSGPKEREQLC